MSLEYRLLGEVLVTVEADDYFPDYTVQRDPVQLRLLSCEECGVVVSGGFGQNRHGQWHAALEASRGAAPADLPY